MADLGTMERVDLPEVWPHEAADFTPSLAQNLDQLDAALGLDLELQFPEAAVGSFSLDALARDRNGITAKSSLPPSREWSCTWTRQFRFIDNAET